MSYQTTILAESGLVSYWELDETSGATAADSKGTTPLTYTGGYTLSATGISGKAVILNGTTGFVGSSTTSPTTAVSNVTLEAWVNLASTSAARQPIVYSGDGNTNGFGLIVNGGTTPPTDGSLYYLLGGKSWNATGAKLTSGWHHVAVALDASSHATVYVDGSQVFTTTNTPNTPSARFNIGTDGTGFLNGTIDAVAAYNTPLSATRTRVHYLAGHYGIGSGGRTSGDGNDASFNFGTTNPLSGGTSFLASCWISVATWDLSYQSLFLQTDGTTTGWVLHRYSTSAGVAYLEPGSGAVGAYSGTNQATGGWVHIAGFHHPTNGLGYLYINGSSVASYTIAGGNPFGVSGQALTLGMASSNLAVAEPALFKGLTQAQANTITANLAAGRSPIVQTPAPVFYSRFGGGTTETDQVGGLSSTLPSNSYVVAGPAVDAPPSSNATMMMHL